MTQKKSNQIVVAIIDDHSIVREGIRSIIEKTSADIHIVAEAANGEEALNIAAKHKIDVYIVDISMPLLNGIELIPKLKKQLPQSKVLILSMHDKLLLAKKAIRNGADGFVIKDNATEIICQAIRSVFCGQSYFSPQISGIESMQNSLRNSPNKTGRGPLTKTEKRILQLVSEGFTYREIAEKLGRSPNTIHVHLNKIMFKLKLHRKADLVRFALKERISFL